MTLNKTSSLSSFWKYNVLFTLKLENSRNTIVNALFRRRMSSIPSPTFQYITSAACSPKQKLNNHHSSSSSLSSSLSIPEESSFTKSKTTTRTSTSSSMTFNSNSLSEESKLFSTCKQWHANSCGEDSFLCRSEIIGVADGVGGWPAGSKANPALYSRLLLDNIGCYMADLDDLNNLDLGENAFQPISVKDLLRRSYQAMDPAVIGSTTVSLAFLQSPWVQFGHLGDCGFMIFRRNGLFLRSEEQQHSFNYPYQLSSKRINSPEDALCLSVRVEPGDLILLGSDGLFDNLFDDDICSLVRASGITNPIGSVSFPSVVEESQQSSSPVHDTNSNNSNNNFVSKYLFKSPTELELNRLARSLVGQARDASRDENYHSPFAKRAIEQGIYAIGGKNDDITAVVAYVALAEDSPDRRL